MKTMKWIGQALGNRKWLIICITAIQCLLAASGIAVALLMREVIDNAVYGNKDRFVQTILVLALVIFGQIAMHFLSRFVEDDTRALIEKSLAPKSIWRNPAYRVRQGKRISYGRIDESYYIRYTGCC